MVFRRCFAIYLCEDYTLLCKLSNFIPLSAMREGEGTDFCTAGVLEDFGTVIQGNPRGANVVDENNMFT